MKNLRLVILILFFAGLNTLVNGQKIKGLTIPKGFTYVPQGKFVFEKDSVSINAFYMYSSEITNIDYREFLNDLKKQGKTKELAIAMVDSTKWRDKNAYNEPYVSYYFSHPAYNFYPVVNITYEAALLYCEWLSGKISELNQGKFNITVRLPSRVEWVYAASIGGTNNPYSWGGPYIRNSKGVYLCNFKAIGEENIFYNNEKKSIDIAKGGFLASDAADITAPARSYFPNKFGLYNMNGNVAEMVFEKGVAVGGSWKSFGYDVRNESIENYTEASTHIGLRPVITVTEKKK